MPKMPKKISTAIGAIIIIVLNFYKGLGRKKIKTKHCELCENLCELCGKISYKMKSKNAVDVLFSDSKMIFS
jgi:hypothetical protein